LKAKEGVEADGQMVKESYMNMQQLIVYEEQYKEDKSDEIFKEEVIYVRMMSELLKTEL
jgi:hypothetical protein